jgi:FixJ family two-component response regulator
MPSSHLLPFSFVSMHVFQLRLFSGQHGKAKRHFYHLGTVRQMMGEPPRPRGVVYVIDDDNHVRSGLINLFESVELQAHAFGSTAEFLAFPRPDAAQCLVLDVRLPGRSGLDFQSELAGANIGIPIIFITAYGDIPMSVKAIKAGAVGFLTKPLREQDLLDAVRVAIETSRADRERNRLTEALRGRFESLSAREREVMALAAAGKLNKQIATEMGISEVTVKVHRHNVMKKMGAGTVVDLVRIAGHLSNLPCRSR